MDPEKRRVYDILGPQYVANPESIDLKDVFTNLSRASCWKRTKLVMLVAAIACILVLQPVLVCINIDKSTTPQSIAMNPYWPWTAILTPLWVFDALILFSYVSHFLTNKKHDEEEARDKHDELQSARTRRKRWMKHISGTEDGFQRQLALILRGCQFVLIVLTELFVALRLDVVIVWKFAVVFIPLYLHQFLHLFVSIHNILRVRSDVNRMVTMQHLEKEVLQRPYADLTDEEKQQINESYIIVHAPMPSGGDEEQGSEQMPSQTSNEGLESSAEFQLAQKISFESQKQLFFLVFHAVFLGLLIPQLDNASLNWSWWLVFLPLWVAIFCSCCSTCLYVARVSSGVAYVVKVDGKKEADPSSPEENVTAEANPSSLEENVTSEEKLEDAPTQGGLPLTSNPSTSVEIETASGESGEKVEAADSTLSQTKESSLEGGSVPSKNELDLEGQDERAGGEDEEEESEEYFLMMEDNSGEVSKVAAGKCCQLIWLITMACLLVGKLQGSNYSALWIIFPLLLPVSLNKSASFWFAFV